MDVEIEKRKELIGYISNSFYCYEEVTLLHSVFTKRKVRCDVLAIPKDSRYAGLTFAFEVKLDVVDRPDEDWRKAIHQAMDYIYAVVDDGKFSGLNGRRVTSAFIFPGNLQHVLPHQDTAMAVERGIIWGGLLVAAHFRVGQATVESFANRSTRFALKFGTNPAWRSDKGFTDQADGLLIGKRQIGSRKVDVWQDLAGMNATSHTTG
jgi:hypothetical protein